MDQLEEMIKSLKSRHKSLELERSDMDRRHNLERLENNRKIRQNARHIKTLEEVHKKWKEGDII